MQTVPTTNDPTLNRNRLQTAIVNGGKVLIEPSLQQPGLFNWFVVREQVGMWGSAHTLELTGEGRRAPVVRAELPDGHAFFTLAANAAADVGVSDLSVWTSGGVLGFRIIDFSRFRMDNVEVRGLDSDFGAHGIVFQTSYTNVVERSEFTNLKGHAIDFQGPAGWWPDGVTPLRRHNGSGNASRLRSVGCFNTGWEWGLAAIKVVGNDFAVDGANIEGCYGGIHMDECNGVNLTVCIDDCDHPLMFTGRNIGVNLLGGSIAGNNNRGTGQRFLRIENVLGLRFYGTILYHLRIEIVRASVPDHEAVVRSIQETCALESCEIVLI
jgi:hypothetical protein